MTGNPKRTQKPRYKPRAIVPQTGRYRNVRSGEIVKCTKGERFPRAPVGSVWAPTTWAENALLSIYDFLKKQSAVLQSIVAIATIIGAVVGSMRRSLIAALILGAVAAVCTSALLIRIVVHREARATPRQRVVAATGAVLLVVGLVVAALWGWQKWQYPLGPPAADDEILVIIAEFEDLSDQRNLEVRYRLIKDISGDLARIQLENVSLREAPVIRQEDGIELAENIGKKYRAAVVIWGWYDDGGFRPYFTVTRPEMPLQRDIEIHTSSKVIIPGTPVIITGTGRFTGGEYLALRDLRMGGEPILPDTFGLYIEDRMSSQMSYLTLFTITEVYYYSARSEIDHQDAKFKQALELLNVAVQRAQEAEVGTEEGKMRDSLALAWFYKGFIQSAILGEEDKALQAYSQAIDLDTDLAYPYNNRGLIYLDQGRYELALDDFGEAVRISPKVSRHRRNRGVTYMELGDYRNAIVDFDYVLSKYADSELYYSRGNAHKYLGEYEQAIDDLTRAIELSPEFAWAYNSRGSAYAAIGEYALAFEDFEHAKELGLHWALPYVNAGDTFVQQGEYQKALDEYNTAATFIEQYEQPGRMSAFSLYLGRAEAYNQLGDYQRAHNDFNTLVRLFDESPDAYIERGYFFFGQGEHKKALEDFNRALQLDSKSAEVHHSLGMVYHAMAEHSAAIAHFSRAIELDSDDPASYVMRATVYSDNLDDEAALRDLNKALELNPTGSELLSIYYNRGLVHIQSQEYQQALADFNEVLEIDPAYANAYYNRGRIYEELGRVGDSIASFERFRDLTEDEYLRGWAERKIDELKTRLGQ